MTFATSRLTRVSAAERGITIGDFLVPIRVGERLSSRARHAALVVAGALLIALTANVAIPIPGSPIPVTGQTFSVLLVGGALGFRRGLLSALLYLLIGFAGMPVFANHAAGVGSVAALREGHLVLGATGGYLAGFLVAGSIVGRLAELGWDRRVGGAFAAMLIGNLVIYAIGVPWLAIAAGQPLDWAIAKGLLPFLLGDALKLALASALFPAAWWLVGHRPGHTR